MTRKRKRSKFNVTPRGLSEGYKSGLEEKIARQLEELGLEVEYESEKFYYQRPSTNHTYTPDFILPNGIVIESKGRFKLEDRKKHLLIQQQFPQRDLRFVFTNSRQKIRKGSKTSYGDWCMKNGFLYADKLIPKEWIKE